MTNPTQDIARALKAYAQSGVESPAELATKLHINNRYARELTGLLMTYGHVAIEEGGEGDVYVITQKGRQALDVGSTAMVNSSQNANTGHQPKEHTMASTKTTKTTKPAKTGTPAPGANDEGRECGCGCGAAVSGKSTFRQGHDARMVSQLVAAVVGPNAGARSSKQASAALPIAFTAEQAELATGVHDIQYRIDECTKVIKAAYGDKLATKAWNAMMNGWGRESDRHNALANKALKAEQKAEAKAHAKAEKAADKAAKPAKTKTIKAKVGRWTYEGHATAEGEFIYTAKGTEKVAPAGKWAEVAA